MVSRSPSAKRISRPLIPIATITTVVNNNIVDLQPSDVTPEAVGLKAYGLSSLPAAWTRPFFVIPSGTNPTFAALDLAIAKLGISRDKKLIIRSSGIDESMENRGALDSAECDLANFHHELDRLRSALNSRTSKGDFRVHWIVQQLMPALAKGHLSNEARVAEDKRDWIVEVEGSTMHVAETRPISLRTWRDNRPPHEEPLLCKYRESYIQALSTVARWSYERLIRIHFEWVWDGLTIYLVQADICDEYSDGVIPKDLVQIPKSATIAQQQLKVFRPATAKDYAKYRKLANARLYRDLGYEMVPFYVLDDQCEIGILLNNGYCSEALKADLAILVMRPLVIRSDGINVPEDLKQMLPRSQELRSTEAAETWLIDQFRTGATSKTSESRSSLAECQPCLIAHHFLPATASAWCQAHPDHRRVRIESLWGLPEGLYWYAYDAYDVDTQSSSAEPTTPMPLKMQTRERRRYKEHFVAPDAEGRWIVHTTASGPAWQRSIRNTAWLKEIAWTSRRIASSFGQPVIVMWFVDIPNAASPHRVLPWYHEPWRADASPNKAAPRRKLSATTDFVLRERKDWELLKERVKSGDPIVRIRVQPSDPEIVREREFAENLAFFAKENHLIIELEGGILSHAYYMLSRAGCAVECANLDDYAIEDFEHEFNKLVRDKIPAAISARGESVTALRLEGAALIAALKRKLIEEAFEVLDARTNDDIAEEIADVREVIDALMSRLEISESNVEGRRKRKLKTRGAFNDALMLTKTAVAAPLEFKEIQKNEGLDKNLVSRTIQKEIEMPRNFSDTHIDKRVDAAGIHERQFTISIPAHAEGYQTTRSAFNLPTQRGMQHEMFLELQIDRTGSDFRIRTRLRNSAVQLELDLSEDLSAQQSDP